MNQSYVKIDQQAEALSGLIAGAAPEVVYEFQQRMDVSWIYHDNAMEGVVLTHAELNAAMDPALISDTSLVAAYDDIIKHREAIEHVRGSAVKKKPLLGLELLKKMHQLVNVETQQRHPPRALAKGATQYRKENPLHRLYFHEISPPEKISYQMRKMAQWFAAPEFRDLHPVRQAALAHHKLITIYPWPKNSGKVSRLLMNLMLLRAGYSPAIIQAVDRQNYYEALRQGPDALTKLVVKSLSATQNSSLAFFGSVAQDSVLAAS
jgi:Fic family protein